MNIFRTIIVSPGLPPLLLASYPVLALYAHNITETTPSDITRSLVVVIGTTLLIQAGIWFFTRDWTKAGLITICGVIIFSTYGHLYELIKPITIDGVFIGRHRYFLPILGAIFTGFVWWMWKIAKKPSQLSRFFSATGIILLILPVFTIVSFQIGSRPALASIPGKISEEQLELQTQITELPDIYYIVLDGYGRQDVLEDFYGYDNSEFINYLKSKDFYVADESRSNYPKTLFSLSSTLNMNYIHDTLALGRSAGEQYFLLNEIYQNSQVRKILEARGYKIVTFDNAYPRAQISNADIFYSLPEDSKMLVPINDFEGIFLNTTIFRVLFDFLSTDHPVAKWLKVSKRFDVHRDEIRFAIDQMVKIPESEGNYFAVVHILAPHPPFVFGPNGEDLNPANFFTLDDGNDFPGTQAEYIEGYRGQLTYMNQLISQAISAILMNSDRKPIIIVQGDHGPGGYLNWDSTSETNMRERFSILNAYYFPNGEYGDLYPSITPINSFRVVFNTIFEDDFELLPDDSYFVERQGRKFFVNPVTERAISD